MRPVPPLTELVLDECAKPQRGAHELVEAVLGDLGFAEERAHEGGWAAQELVGNALRHANAPVILHLHHLLRWVMVSVIDGLAKPFDVHRYTAVEPVLSLEALDALPLEAPNLEHQRGLATVARICEGRLGCCVWPGCKTVWFALSAPRDSTVRSSQVAKHLGGLSPLATAPSTPSVLPPRIALLSA